MESRIEIVRDINFYEKLIDKKRALGLYPEALSLLWQVQRNLKLYKQNYNKFCLIAGQLYSEMGLWEISNSHLFKITTESEYVLPASVIIADNYINLNKKIKALIFIEKVLDENADFSLNDKMREVLCKIKRLEKTERKQLFKKDPFSYNIAHAKTLIRNGFYKDATMLIEEIPPESRCYLDGQNLITTIYILKKNYKNAKKQAYFLIRKYPKNIFNCCNFIKIALQENNKKCIRKYLNLLSMLQLKTLGDYYVSGITYASLKMHKNAFECFSKNYNSNKYVKKTALLFCISAFNCKKRKIAIKTLVRLINIYPKDKKLKNILADCRFIEEYDINLQLSYNII